VQEDHRREGRDAEGDPEHAGSCQIHRSQSGRFGCISNRCRTAPRGANFPPGQAPSGARRTPAEGQKRCVVLRIVPEWVRMTSRRSDDRGCADAIQAWLLSNFDGLIRRW